MGSLRLRVRKHISRKQASNSRPAILLAEKLGTPLNQVATINFTCQGVDNEDAVHRILDKIRMRYCRWAKQPGKKRGGASYNGAMIWTLEDTGHYAAHMMIHVPKERLARFKVDLEQWIEKDSGHQIQPGVIDIREIYNPFGLRKYILKGIDPLFAKLYRINPIPQGIINGKRFGYTQNLGPSQCVAQGTKKPYRWPQRAAA